MRPRPVIVGGGLAGASAACLLAEAGLAPLVLERTTGPTHKVCGEFLSEDALSLLERIGIDAAALGAHPITTLRLIHRSSCATVPLPFRAVGLSRRVLDEALLARAAALGAEIRRGAQVERIDPGPAPLIHLAHAAPIEAHTLLLATGKHDVRGLRRPARPDERIGFKLHLRLSPAQTDALSGHIELILWDGGYGGLQPIEGGRANLCLLVERARFQRSGGTWAGLLDALAHEQPHLRARLDGAAPLWERPLSVARIPYGHVHRAGRGEAGAVFTLGDQAAVIPSFTGDGMAMALWSAASAARAVLGGEGPAEHHARVAHCLGRQVRGAMALDRLLRAGAGRAVALALARAWPGGVGWVAGAVRVGGRGDQAWPSSPEIGAAG